MASCPLELAQDAVYQSHTSRLTELWSLPRPAQGLNTNNNNYTSDWFIVLRCSDVEYMLYPSWCCPNGGSDTLLR